MGADHPSSYATPWDAIRSTAPAKQCGVQPSFTFESNKLAFLVISPRVALLGTGAA